MILNFPLPYVYLNLSRFQHMARNLYLEHIVTRHNIWGSGKTVVSYIRMIDE